MFGLHKDAFTPKLEVARKLTYYELRTQRVFDLRQVLGFDWSGWLNPNETVGVVQKKMAMR